MSPKNFAMLLGFGVLVSCSGDEDTDIVVPDYGAEVCDAGEEAWVERTFELVLGRKVHGAAEITRWATVSREHGREAVVRALTRSPEYVDHWSDWLNDALAVARTGDRSNGACYANPTLTTDRGELAIWLQTAAADGAPFAASFNMADVIHSALWADDLSAAYRVNLFARMATPVQGANVGPRGLEEARRKGFGEGFQHTYLNRDLVCLSCHNSEFATTDSNDPATDRHWPIPGLFEKAVLGNSFGIDEGEAFQVFRYNDLMQTPDSTESPFGMSTACGRFTPADGFGEDYLGHEGYFIEAFGDTGSVWNIEAYLAEGVDNVAALGLQVDADGTIAGPEAFAYLVGENIAGQVWKEATGERLTIANYFPRNQAQRDRLKSLTDTFVEHRFSLVELLVAVATDPYYNAGAPTTCDADPYGMAPVVNPWATNEQEPHRRNNGPGDFVHRHGARTLVHSVHDSLGWNQPAAFLSEDDPTQRVELALGAFMRDSQPGFTGTDFQGVLAFEAAYGACETPEVTGAGDGCAPTPGVGGCASCDCQTCVCATDSYCCDVQWDAVCVDLCNGDECGGCGGGMSSGGDDVIEKLLSNAKTRGTTVGEVVLALKDRLIARGEVDPEEKALIEALLETPLDVPISEAGDIEPAIRVLCGAILISPDYFLSIDPGGVGPIPALALDDTRDCEWAATLLATQDIAVTCEGGK